VTARQDANLDEAAIACHVGLFINMGQVRKTPSWPRSRANFSLF
jgi:hypothetical protein